MNKINVRVILKTGSEFTMECDSVKVKFDTRTGACISFDYEGCTKNRPVYLNLPEIVAVIQEEG